MRQRHRLLLLAAALCTAAVLLPEASRAGKKRSTATKHQVPKWKWSAKATKLKWYAAKYKGKHRVVVPRGVRRFRKAAVRVRRGARTVARFQAHAETPFVIIGDRVLVYTVHSAIASGCVLVAYDLKTRKQRWKVRLKGIGLTAHSEYRNRINLRAGPGPAVTVYGWESHGRYLEVRDLKNGKALTHRKLP